MSKEFDSIMGEVDVVITSLKETLNEFKKSVSENNTEVKEAITKLSDDVVEIKLLLVDKYVKKEDFETYKKEEIVTRRWWAGFIIGGMSMVLGFLKIITPYLFK